MFWLRNDAEFCILPADIKSITRKQESLREQVKVNGADGTSN